MPDLQDAISLLEKGHAREASVLLVTMTEEMPGYATARVLLARSYEGLGDWNGALAAWREALHIVPNSPVIRRGLERAARKATSRAPIEELPELPSMSVSTPSPGDVRVADAEADDEPEGPAFDASLSDSGIPPLEPEAAAPDVEDVAQDFEDTAPGGEDVAVSPSEGEDAAGFEGAAQDVEDARQDVEGAEPAPPGNEDLDRLIAELESARIVPRPDLEGLPEPALEDDIEDIVSVTLARIYASQGQYDEAARVYDLLADQQPDNEQEFRAKAAEMREKASEE